MALATAVGPKSRTVIVMDPDLPLVDASRNGDVSAFEELVSRYDRKLYRIVQGITHSSVHAEDVLQNAFLKAHQNLNRFQCNAMFSTWLIRIAMNESFIKLRKQRANREQPLDSDNGLGDKLSQNCFDLTDWAANPESLYSATEIRKVLENCLQKLHPRLRVVFLLRDIEGPSICETSEILNLTATAVKTRLSRARLRLRQELTRYFKSEH